MTDITDLVIVGGGPGGQAAARAAIRHGLRVTVLDEQARPGGQIFRQPFADGIYPKDRFGAKHAAAGRAGAALCAEPLIDWQGNRMVWGLTPGGEDGFELFHSGPDGAAALKARRVLIAAGCHDMAVPFPGWTLSGVMGAGGIQAMLKGQGVAPGASILLGGSHPLMLVIAAQLLDFGVTPVGVVFSQSFGRIKEMLGAPLVASRSLPVFAQGARAYLKLHRAGVPVHFGKVVVRAEGDDTLQQVRIAPSDRLDATGETIACDAFGFCYGFTSSAELPRQIGVDPVWSETGGGWIIPHDARMQTSQPGLYVAGETAGIGGEPCAVAEGVLAGLTIAESLGKSVSETEIARAQTQRRHRRDFATLLQRLADPGAALLQGLRDDDTAICRCESVKTGAFRALLRDNPTIHSADAAKLLARTGMGPCQGRFCHRAVQEEIAAARGGSTADAKPFAARMPARPVPLRDLRSLSRDGNE
ncbi:FAD-dependent oxidoreductase [Thalassovita mangrovi]|uniref:FAD-dependent oxidoreductase n=1 Tax=Thalassovita mangrovi TaxID=2692236 RepID=A0A6L8LNX8_9RHOB|nr:FAD-dependent oxidoreductase [Thalassovita mangrovi]MYM57585.1 FAD-dependent oxidoreductase [Thalassovita mangrovi]